MWNMIFANISRADSSPTALPAPFAMNVGMTFSSPSLVKAEAFARRAKAAIQSQEVNVCFRDLELLSNRVEDATTSTLGMLLSTRWAAVSVMRRAPQFAVPEKSTVWAYTPTTGHHFHVPGSGLKSIRVRA
jgi:hypothetical protein